MMARQTVVKSPVASSDQKANLLAEAFKLTVSPVYSPCVLPESNLYNKHLGAKDGRFERERVSQHGKATAQSPRMTHHKGLGSVACEPKPTDVDQDACRRCHDDVQVTRT